MLDIFDYDGNQYLETWWQAHTLFWSRPPEIEVFLTNMEEWNDAIQTS